jgi:hypothetical protein
MAKTKPPGGLAQFIQALRDAGVTEYEGPGPDGPVKLKLGPAPAGPRAVTGKVIGPAPAKAPDATAKHLQEAGVDADMLAEAQERAQLLFPS